MGKLFVVSSGYPVGQIHLQEVVIVKGASSHDDALRISGVKYDKNTVRGPHVWDVESESEAISVAAFHATKSSTREDEIEGFRVRSVGFDDDSIIVRAEKMIEDGLLALRENARKYSNA
jgi:hypothetical protein